MFEWLLMKQDKAAEELKVSENLEEGSVELTVTVQRSNGVLRIKGDGTVFEV
jgi:hypothetical protein